jgi:hypothetical protein
MQEAQRGLAYLGTKDVAMSSEPAFEITLFRKHRGSLTKRIHLAADGKLTNDSSACIMGDGTAQRVRLGTIRGFAELIGQLESNEAIALGALRDGLPESVRVVTKATLARGEADGPTIARDSAHIVHRAGQPGPVLIDFDRKGLPEAVAARLAEAGGFLAALTIVMPELAAAARVERASTSAALYRIDTGERFESSGGQHEYIFATDSADSDRFLRDLHKRACLAGFGWGMIGRGGKFLERSIVDRMVGAPERLVFEGAPIIEPPLVQDAEARQPTVTEGGLLDTRAACRPLGPLEGADFERLALAERARLAPHARDARARFVAEQAGRLVERTGCPPAAARKAIERQCEGILHPGIELPFDEPNLAGKTVADVLADPDRFVGETLADPIEGIEYGRCKAMIMRRDNGPLWVHSFAHGGAQYELRLDFAAAMKAIESAIADANAAGNPSNAVGVLCGVVLC